MWAHELVPKPATKTEKTSRAVPLVDTVLFQHKAHRACALLYVNSMASETCAAKSEADICKVRHRSLKLLRKPAALFRRLA